MRLLLTSSNSLTRLFSSKSIWPPYTTKLPRQVLVHSPEKLPNPSRLFPKASIAHSGSTSFAASSSPNVTP